MNPGSSEPVPQLRADCLRRSFRMASRKIEVLRGISLDIFNGEAIFLCGASGAGKTTLLYTLAGLERPESGQVFFEGQALYSGGERFRTELRNRKIGFVFQGYFLLPELTALENVLLPSMIGGTRKPDAAEIVAGKGRPRATGSIISRRNSPAASSSASPSPARSSTIRPSFSPTSRPAISTPERARPSSICFLRSCAKSGKRWWWSPTIRVWHGAGIAAWKCATACSTERRAGSTPASAASDFQDEDLHRRRFYSPKPTRRSPCSTTACFTATAFSRASAFTMAGSSSSTSTWTGFWIRPARSA